MFKKYSKLLLTLCCLPLLIIAGCGGGGQAGAPKDAGNKDVKLEFWTIALQPKFNDYFNTLIAGYEKSHPHVRIEWKDYPYDAITQKLLTSMAGGDSPDVVNLNTEFASQMGLKGAVVDVNKYLSDEQKNSYFTGIFQSTVIDGKAYALPWYTGTDVLFMNTKIVKQAGLDPTKPPQTRDELEKWMRQVKAKTGKIGYAQQLVSKLLPIEGIPILTKDKTAAAFNKPETVAMLNHMKKLMDEGLMMKEDDTFQKQIQYYAAEQTAFELGGPTFINFIKTAAPDVYKNTMAVPLPTGHGDLRLSNSMNLVVPVKSKHPQEAVEFAAFVTNADNQTSFAKQANTLPSTKASIQDPYFSKSDGSLEAQAKIASAQGLDKATDYMVGVPNARDVNAAITRGVQSILLNGQDAQKTLNEVEQEVNGILKK